MPWTGKKVVFNADGLQIDEVIVDEEHCFPKSGELFPGFGYSFRVGVDSQQLAAGRALSRIAAACPAAAEGGINITTARLNSQGVEGFR